MNRFFLLALGLGFGIMSCKPSDTPPDPEAILQCPSSPKTVQGWGGRGSFIMPNAFSANGDGRNDRFRLVCSDTAAIRSMSVRIIDGGGNVITTLRSPADSWDGYNVNKGDYYPAGYYRVDYGIDLHGGTGEDAVLNGHICLKLYRSDSGKTCINAINGPKGDVFEDQVDPATSNFPYTTAESYCQ